VIAWRIYREIKNISKKLFTSWMKREFRGNQIYKLKVVYIMVGQGI
jgi:hypothetical protein